MHDASIDLAVFAAILNDSMESAAVHHMSASVADLFEVTESLQPTTPIDLWKKYYRPPLETDGLTSVSDFETKLIPHSKTLDGFLDANHASIQLCGSGLHLIDTESYNSKQDACASIENCSGWWRFSRIGYNADNSEALVHTDYDHPKYRHMGMGHFVLLTRDVYRWVVAAKHMTWIS